MNMIRPPYCSNHLKNDKRQKYYAFNKPYGVVATLSDPEGRVTIAEYIKKIKTRVYPIGRLDFHSEGLILLTNDGDLTNFIISPKNEIERCRLGLKIFFV